MANELTITLFDGKKVKVTPPVYALEAHNAGKWIVLEVQPFTSAGYQEALKNMDKYPYQDMQIEKFD